MHQARTGILAAADGPRLRRHRLRRRPSQKPRAADAALRRANEIRSARAKLKRDLKAGKAQIEKLLLDPPDYVLSAKAFDMILAVPKYGRVKANKILTQCRISPSKTIGGLSERQRAELVQPLRRSPTEAPAAMLDRSPPDRLRDDADAARRFFSDVLGLPSVDAGDGWLIFAMPPTELRSTRASGWASAARASAVPGLRDIESTVAELRAVELTDEITREEWGLVTMLKVPGHGEVGLYQPTHASLLEGVGTD